MALRPFPHSASQVDRYPGEKEVASLSKPRHKPSYSISEQSRSRTPVLSTSASFPSLRAASAMALKSPPPPPPPGQGKLSGLASATKQRARDVWSRRKPTPELDTSMKPVRELIMDSPTIPGRPPISNQHERNPSAGHNWRQNVFGEAMLSSIEPPPPIAQCMEDITPIDASSDVEKPISPFNLLSPTALNPSPVTPIDTIDSPPKVPPKGHKDVPRTNLDVDRTGTVQRSNSTIRADIPPRASSALGTMRPREVVVPRKKISSEIITDRMVSKALNLGKNQKIFTRQRADTAPSQATTSTTNAARPKLHINTNPNVLSPTSAMTEEEAVQRKPRRRKSSSIEAALPRGMKPAEASNQFSITDIEILQQAAKLQTENYGVLKPADVRFLQKELEQLDSRCQYLKETQKSLRAGRKTLQSRMLTYLRSSRSGIFSRESLLKQEEALAELDEAIEDWEQKVERAEERRLQVSRKLLEHAAAILSVRNDHLLPLRIISTPPGTPDKPRKARADVESITVYALLADVEQELGRMLS